MPEKPVHQPNDKLFRSTFSEIRNAAGFLQAYLDPAIVAATDWGTLQQLSGGFIDSELAGSESDLLFSVSVKEEKTFLYILFEHQSREDPWMALRLLSYMVRIWEKQRTEAGASGLPVRLWPILPVVLAQGRERWKTENRFGALFGPGAKGPHFPEFTFDLIELVGLEYGQMQGTPEGVLTLRVLRADSLGELLHALILDETLLLQASRESIERLFRYITNRDVDSEAFRRRVRGIVNTTLKEQAMTLAEQLRQEGRQEGRIIGREEEAQRAVLDVLEARFQRVPVGLAEEIALQRTLDRLRQLHLEALRCVSLEDFAAKLGI